MLEIKNITKIFNITGNESDKKIALDDFSLSINDGDFVTIIGSNGSGKSTLMNILSGTIKPDKGNVLLDGKVITQIPEYKRAKFFGRVFQDPNTGTCGNMSIWENLEIANKRGLKHRLVWGFSKQRKGVFITKLKKFGLGLEDRMEQKVSLLSGGQRQALTLLMASLNNPKVLLLDEHTAALDPKTARKVLDFTDLIVKENKLTTLMITHNMKDALTYGNRLIMLHEGKIILDVKDEEKAKLTVDDLVKMFDKYNSIYQVD